MPWLEKMGSLWKSQTQTTDQLPLSEDRKLSANFSLSEMVRSSTAERHGIDNWPKEQYIIDNLELVCQNILQPIRTSFGRPIRPNSGYRCLKLNKKLGSKPTSQHVQGQAVDVEIPGVSNYDLAKWVRDNLEYDQLILEFYYPGKPSSGWVHVSFKESGNRGKVLTINRNGAVHGLLK